MEAQRDKKTEGVKGRKESKASKGSKASAASSKEKEKIPCPHSYCNLPSDPSYYPKGLPWASGLLKCLPGYCPKRRVDDIAEEEEKKDEEQKEEEPVVPEPEGLFDSLFQKRKKRRKCECEPCIEELKRRAQKRKRRKREQKSSLGLKRKMCPGDPQVDDELLFFLKVIIMADDLDDTDEMGKKRKMRKTKQIYHQSPKSSIINIDPEPQDDAQNEEEEFEEGEQEGEAELNEVEEAEMEEEATNEIEEVIDEEEKETEKEEEKERRESTSYVIPPKEKKARKKRP